jgi:hypothetical protein
VGRLPFVKLIWEGKERKGRGRQEVKWLSLLLADAGLIIKWNEREQSKTVKGNFDEI